MLLLHLSIEPISHLSEKDNALQARHLVFVDGIHVRHDGVLALGHLLWDRDALCEIHGALFERAAEVDVADLVAQVGLLLDERDDAVFDLQKDLGAGLDVLGEGACGGDGEVAARGGRVGVKVDVVD